MDASLQTALKNLQILDYCSVAVVVTIGYDYLLTLGREVELVWKRPWSFMSFLYVIIRYLGIVLAITNALGGSFVYLPMHVRIVLFKFVNWGGYVYTIVVEVIMILRVYAMYNQPRTLLRVLLLLFLPVLIIELVGAIIYFGPRSGVYATDVPLLGMQICTVTSSLSLLPYAYLLIPGVVFDGVLAAFAIVRLVRHTADMKKALGGCTIDIWLRMFVRDSILYFFGNLMYRSLNLIQLINLPPTYKTLVQTFCAVEPFILPPRLIISFRYYHEQIVTNSDAGKSMESMVFQLGDPDDDNNEG